MLPRRSCSFLNLPSPYMFSIVLIASAAKLTALYPVLQTVSQPVPCIAMPCPSFPASKSTSAPAFGAPTCFGGHLRRSCCWKSWKLRRRCLHCLRLQGRSSGDALEGRLQRSLRRRPVGRRLLRCQWWSGGHFGGHGWDGDPIGVVLWLRDRSELRGKWGQVLGRLKLHRHQRGG